MVRHTLTARRLAGGDLEGLGRQAHWTLDSELLLLGSVNQIAADYTDQQQSH
jgi:hypothetical protein